MRACTNRTVNDKVIHIILVLVIIAALFGSVSRAAHFLRWWLARRCRPLLRRLRGLLWRRRRWYWRALARYRCCTSVRGAIRSCPIPVTEDKRLLSALNIRCLVIVVRGHVTVLLGRCKEHLQLIETRGRVPALDHENPTPDGCTLSSRMCVTRGKRIEMPSAE